MIHRTIVHRTVGLAAIVALGASAVAGTDLLPQPKMSDPLNGLTSDQLTRFIVGRFQYDRTFEDFEGLGPVFNKESCGNCHGSPLGGPGSQTVTRAGLSDKGSFSHLEEFGGSLFQQESISEACAEQVHGSANIIAFRVTPGMLGYGLVQAIPDADLLAHADPTDLDGDGISGRAHLVTTFEDPPKAPLRVGRFGWKAQVATMLTFSADAGLNEIGLTNPFLPEENDPNGVLPPTLEECDTVPDPEVGLDFLEQLADFQRFLAPPPQTPKSGMTGEAIFTAIGCATCHVPAYTTSNDPALEDAIRDRVVKPYSDFLLHDMGAAADFIPQGDATEREIRTAPLMGVRRRDPIWHDGRFAGGTFADRIGLAIAEHGAFGSEAVDVVAEWDALSGPEQAQVIAFLDSLGRREFDADGDDVVNLFDFTEFHACMTGPGSFYTPDDPCSVHDIDQDGDVDLDDYGKFLLVYLGPAEDCNLNGVLDITDIAMGFSRDWDGNGTPDECECASDIDDDGVTDFQDLLALISVWGPCVECPEDLNGNGDVNFQDLLLLLTNWGTCPE